MRIPHIVAVLLLAPLAAPAQDMPLFTILQDGEVWKKGEGEKPKRLTQRTIHPPAPESKTEPKFDINVCAFNPDRATLFFAKPSSDAVWAYQVKDGEVVNPAPYAPLRIRLGYDNTREAREKLKNDPPKLAVTALTVDEVGRIYAGTTSDLQIFDPTGRLCGVVSLPATGNPEFLRWEGEKQDTLVLWIGEQKWTRKLNVSGK